MEKENVDYIRRVFGECFAWMEATDKIELFEMMKDAIIQDIEECADKEFNDSDIRMAISRTMLLCTGNLS